MSLAFLFRNFGIVSAISSPIRSVIARVDSVVSTPFRFLDSANEEIRDLFNTYSENKELKQKVAELEDQSELIDSLKKKMRSLIVRLELYHQLLLNFQLLERLLSEALFLGIIR